MKAYWREYFKLVKFAKPYRGLLVLAAVCMGASTLFNGVSFTMILPLFDRVFTDKEIILPMKLPLFLEAIIDKLNTVPPMVILESMAVFMIVLFTLKGIFLFLQNYLMNIVGQSVVREVRNKIYAKFHQLSLEFYARKRTGELISRITNDVGHLTQAISCALADLIYNTMQAIFYAFFAVSLAFCISWKLPIVVFVIFPVILFPVIKIGKKIKTLTGEVQKKMADMNSLLSETIQGAYIVKVFGREDYELKRFKGINFQYFRFILKSAKRTLMLSPLTEFIGGVGGVIVLLLIGREVIAEKISFGVFGVFLASLMSMIKPIKKLSNVHAINQQAFSAAERVYEVLEEEVKIKEKGNAKNIREITEGIHFDNVWFKYEDDDVLKGIELEVKKGEVIALVGHSGAGKSTLVSLLPRLYDPYKGKILIDGVDLKNLKLKSLRKHIAVVSQEMVLFNATVRDNIAYGKEGATEEEIVEAAKKAYAYKFIKNLPEGFSTVIGDRGFKLSGGERQRISIARAILKGAPVLILDEATSHLDSESEQLVKEALYNLMEGKTVFVIAHRLSTVQKANRIAVMESGRIVELGTHSSLLLDDAVYKKLHELQFKA
jgi:subfamily B ATP-binding cassette protein MsbA